MSRDLSGTFRSKVIVVNLTTWKGEKHQKRTLDPTVAKDCFGSEADFGERQLTTNCRPSSLEDWQLFLRACESLLGTPFDTCYPIQPKSEFSSIENTRAGKL